MSALDTRGAGLGQVGNGSRAGTRPPIPARERMKSYQQARV